MRFDIGTVHRTRDNHNYTVVSKKSGKYTIQFEDGEIQERSYSVLNQGFWRNKVPRLHIGVEGTTLDGFRYKVISKDKDYYGIIYEDNTVDSKRGSSLYKGFNRYRQKVHRRY